MKIAEKLPLKMLSVIEKGSTNTELQIRGGIEDSSKIIFLISYLGETALMMGHKNMFI